MFQGDCKSVADGCGSRSARWQRHPVHQGSAVKIYTALLKPDAKPVLVREGFAWGAAIFGPFWLAVHRAWIAAAISLAAYVLIAILAPRPAVTILAAGVAVMLGLSGHDLRR